MGRGRRGFGGRRGGSSRGRGGAGQKRNRFGFSQREEQKLELNSKKAKLEQENARFVPPSKDESESSSDTSSESETEEPHAYDQLLGMLGTTSASKCTALGSSAEEESESDDEEKQSDEEMEPEEETEDEEDGEDDVSLQSKDDGNTSLGNGDPLADQEEYDAVEDEEEVAENDLDMGQLDAKDPFHLHFEGELPDSLLEPLSSTKPYNTQEDLSWPTLGHLNVQVLERPVKTVLSSLTSEMLGEEHAIITPGKIPVAPSALVGADHLFVKQPIKSRITSLTTLQQELLSLMVQYQDVLYSERTSKNGEEIRHAYCLHALNHVLKARSVVLQHNAKINKKKAELSIIGKKAKNLHVEYGDEFRDQGLARPRVLIVVPFRESVVRIVQMLVQLLVGEEKGGNVMHRKRFDEEYLHRGEKKEKHYKPDDWEETFAGNIDDAFRIGISITKRCLKLYTNFYASDIIIASPLGLRLIIGAEGEADRDFDFLSSIEVLVLDQADVLMMQNWDHILHLVSHLHLQPRDSHGVDFTRVRLSMLQGWAKYYRQTLAFSTVYMPELSGLFSKHCRNFGGIVRIHNPTSLGSVGQVVPQLPMAFHRFDSNSAAQAMDARFEFFVSKLLPQFNDALMAHTLICIPSYFDYVRLRNYLRKEEIEFAEACEYTEDGKLAQAREIFFKGKLRFMLYTERLHFYRRYRIKGIRHLVFYQLPMYPHFYSEMCNLLQASFQPRKYQQEAESTASVTVLYCQYDAPRLAAVVSTERARTIMTSQRNVHLIVTGSR